MWTRRIIACLFSCLLSPPLLADSSSGGVQLQLTQRPDTDCDGFPEDAGRVAPGECLIYEIQAINSEDKIYRNLLIASRIPEHSMLMRPYARVDDDAPVDSMIKQGTNGVRLLKTRLEVLHPGYDNRVVLHYSVRIL